MRMWELKPVWMKTEDCKGQPVRAGYCESRIDTRVQRTPGEARVNIQEAISIAERTAGKQGAAPRPVGRSAFQDAMAILQNVKRRK